jgi:hypothetical protein
VIYICDIKNFFPSFPCASSNHVDATRRPRHKSTRASSTLRGGHFIQIPAKAYMHAHATSTTSVTNQTTTATHQAGRRHQLKPTTRSEHGRKERPIDRARKDIPREIDGLAVLPRLLPHPAPRLVHPHRSALQAGHTATGPASTAKCVVSSRWPSPSSRASGVHHAVLPSSPLITWPGSAMLDYFVTSSPKSFTSSSLFDVNVGYVYAIIYFSFFNESHILNSNSKPPDCDIILNYYVSTNSYKNLN